MTGRIFIDITPDFKPGDPPPDGYVAWHEWARVQLKAKLKQARCGVCGLLRFPQEMSERILTNRAMDGRGKWHVLKSKVCLKCDAKKTISLKE